MEPKLISFKYTKDSGEVSERKLITLSTATHLTSGVDISKFEGTPAEMVDILNEIKNIEEGRLRLIYDLLDAVPSIQIKSFKEKNMSNTTDITRQYQEKMKVTK